MGQTYDYNQKIDIGEIAQMIGYIRDYRAGGRHAKWHLYALYQEGFKVDVILVNSVNRTYSSQYNPNDHGTVVDFVKNHITQFIDRDSAPVGVMDPIWYESKSVLEKFLGNNLMQKEAGMPVNLHKEFSLNDYKITWPKNCKYLDFLTIRRNISEETIQRFLEMKAIARVRDLSYEFAYNNIGFPMRIPGNEMITNFELRNYNRNKGESFKGFCPGGDKANSLWIATEHEDGKQVNDVYVFESAIDAMSFSELVPTKSNVAYVSCGGNMTMQGISLLPSVFPNANFHSCCDNDPQGNSYDVKLYYFLENKPCHSCYHKPLDKLIFFIDGKEENYKASEFDGARFLQMHDKVGLIHKCDSRFKDWNDQLSSVKEKQRLTACERESAGIIKDMPF